jgi:hypothetical protein
MLHSSGGSLVSRRGCLDAFLKEHEVYDFTCSGLEQDRETLSSGREMLSTETTLAIVGVADISSTLGFRRAHSAESRNFQRVASFNPCRLTIT